ncbi:MAG: glycosyltransferase family 9 protein [Chloroflexus aggregans]|uniref:Glycosyltransferase family 9 protein n=1 Tax=Chloroflexus aggregans TaxID=152260 RepID=A0A2J6WXJ1_9CHLR|nr:MAG: glycosyltransferase family 9 protein [Chloroflexus aggregans]
MRALFLHLLATVAQPLVRRANAHPPQRILIIKPDHLGDLLLATPALAALRTALPTAHLTALVGPWAAPMWQRLPELDALVTLPFPGFDRTVAKPSRLTPYLLLLREALRLRRQRFDAALIMRDDHWWGAALALLTGIPRRIGFAHPLCRPLLSEALDYHPRQHVTQQALDLVAALTGHRPPPAPLRFSPTPAAREWAAIWYQTHVAPNEQLIIIHPGTGGPTKHWLHSYWIALIQSLRRPRRRFLLTGSPAEHAALAALATELPDVLMLSVEMTIDRLAALFVYAELVIGVDSGPLHIAVSQGVPTIHLFGPSDPLRFGPWGDGSRHHVLSAGIACSPCGVFAACPRATDPPECMVALTPASVVAAAETLLATVGSGL